MLHVLSWLRQKTYKRKKKKVGEEKLKQNQLELGKTIPNKSKRIEKPADEEQTDDRFADADLDCGDSGSEMDELVSYELMFKKTAWNSEQDFVLDQFYCIRATL